MLLKNKKNRKIITPARILVLGFAAIILVGAFLLTLPISHNDGQWFPFIDALFTATTSVCVTGLTVVDIATQFNFFGQAVVLILIQVGGLGVMTATTLLFLMVRKRITLKNRMVIQESLSQDRLQGVVKSIRNILILTFAIELVGAFMLMCSFIPLYGGLGVWISIFTSVSAFCNAGIDILGVATGNPMGSLTNFVGNAWVCLPVIMLIIIGGLGFMVLADIGDSVKRRKKLTVNSKVVLLTTAALILFGWISILILEWDNTLSEYDVGTKILAALFQSVTPRTAGFNTINIGGVRSATFMVLLTLMFIGASPASTGGGIKTTTVALLLLTVIRTLQGKRDVVLKRSKVPVRQIRKAITVVAVMAFIVIINSLIVMICEYGNPEITAGDIVFEVVSAVSTTGLSMGITPYLTVGSKVMLVFSMFIGRIGVLTLGVSLAKGNTGIDSKVEYSDAKILVG